MPWHVRAASCRTWCRRTAPSGVPAALASPLLPPVRSSHFAVSRSSTTLSGLDVASARLRNLHAQPVERGGVLAYEPRSCRFVL